MSDLFWHVRETSLCEYSSVFKVIYPVYFKYSKAAYSIYHGKMMLLA